MNQTSASIQDDHLSTAVEPQNVSKNRDKTVLPCELSESRFVLSIFSALLCLHRYGEVVGLCTVQAWKDWHLTVLLLGRKPRNGITCVIVYYSLWAFRRNWATFSGPEGGPFSLLYCTRFASFMASYGTPRLGQYQCSISKWGLIFHFELGIMRGTHTSSVNPL